MLATLGLRAGPRVGATQDSRAEMLRAGTDALAVGPCECSNVGRTVLIVDDHPAFRSAARALLQAAGFDVVGDAPDGSSALEAVRRLRPEIVLLDVQLPDFDGFLVAEELAAGPAPPAIVLTSSRSVASLRWRLTGNPAWRFIPKHELSAEALAAALG